MEKCCKDELLREIYICYKILNNCAEDFAKGNEFEGGYRLGVAINRISYMIKDYEFEDNSQDEEECDSCH